MIQNMAPSKLASLMRDATTHAFGCLSPAMIKFWKVNIGNAIHPLCDCHIEIKYEPNDVMSASKGTFNISKIILPLVRVEGLNLTGLGYPSDPTKVKDGFNYNIEDNKFHIRVGPQIASEDTNPGHVVLGEYVNIMFKRLQIHVLSKMFESKLCQVAKKQNLLTTYLAMNPAVVTENGWLKIKGADGYTTAKGVRIPWTHPKLYAMLFEQFKEDVNTSCWQEMVLSPDDETKKPKKVTKYWQDIEKTSMTFKHRVFAKVDPTKIEKEVQRQDHGGVVYPPSVWQNMSSNAFFAIRELEANGHKYQSVKFQNKRNEPVIPESDRLEGEARLPTPSA